jgi:hypothetical protein
MLISYDKSFARLMTAALILGAVAAGCGGSDDDERGADKTAAADETSVSQASIGTCTRNQLELRSPIEVSCALDTSCPCGSYCDTADHICKFTCNVPPQSPAEACASGKQCDDTGRCVTPGAMPAANGVTMAAIPPVLEVAPSGGAAAQLTVRLSLYSSVAADLTRATTTVVRAVSEEGYEVSCNASTFGGSCELASWTFAWDGTRNNATRPLWVRSLSANAGTPGQVRLLIDELGAEVAVVTSPSIPESRDGVYTGIATSPNLANGVQVTVRARGDLLLVRDPSQVIAPDGALLLDYRDDVADPLTPRRLPWLRPVGAPATAGALLAEVATNGLANFLPQSGSLSTGYTVTLPGGVPESWSLQLQRSGDHAPECTVTADCAAGNECVAALQACVPAQVATPLADPLGNNFEDPRSLAWWNAISGMLGTADNAPVAPARPAFATTGADLIEALMCSTSEADTTGRLGVAQLRQSSTSRSGDLGCVTGGGAGVNNSAPGAVGLLTYRDRWTSNDTPEAMLNTCMADLARPVSSDWNANFGSTVGQCLNLARFVPALRLLGASELDKRTKPASPRLRGLLVRLVQQWSQLYGFLASTGLTEREYDDVTGEDLADARTELLALLDKVDAGWAALLDKRVTAAVAEAAPWAPTATVSTNDYREAKKPIAYWTFNGGKLTDEVRGVQMNLISSTTKDGCKILTSRNSIAGDWNCPGHLAVLPANGPQVGPGDLTIAMHLHDKSVEFPPYSGGTLFITETMAAVSKPLQATAYQPTLAVVHPTADGGTEWVAFDWTYGFYATSFAIVRDTTRMTYTLYARMNLGQTPTDYVLTQRYYHPVGGKLGVSPRNVRLASGQFPNYSSFPGQIDDFAIFGSALSKREALRFVNPRGVTENQRYSWPGDMNLVDSDTQEIKVGMGATMLEGQVAYLGVVARLAEHLKHEVPAACSGTDPTARSNFDAAVVRAGRSIRQSIAIENLARLDSTDRAVKARQELRARRSAISRTLSTMMSCNDPYGLGANEVPLYFGDVLGEVTAFFAASDHLLKLATERVADAQATFNTAQGNWVAARQSKIQEQLTVTNRDIRITELETRFGDQLKRLCGITERTTQQVMLEVKNGTFNVEMCPVNPTPACLAQHQTTDLMNADPLCYRGIIGAQMMDMRAAYHAHQAAYAQWQAALGNADGAERHCVWKEMDLYGCSALDRHQLTGITCPPNHQGTNELIVAFNQEITSREEAKGWMSAITGAISSIAKVAAVAVGTGGAGAAFMVAAGNSLSVLGPVMEADFERRRRNHAATLQLRAAEAQIMECWTEAEQFQRAIAAAEETSKEARARMQTAIILHQNAMSEAREIVLEAPISIERELTRPSIPIAFHYWVPQAMANYRFHMDRARRYTYMALRATEYDLQQTFGAPPTQIDQPSRAAVLGAWRPDTLAQQVTLLKAATDARRAGNARPSEDHLVVNVATELFGLPVGDPSFGVSLQANARPVYSTRGEYLGEGVRFSFVPADASSPPLWRCAERLARANVGRSANFSGALGVKLFKRTVFASRSCDAEGLKVSTLRPQSNLLISGGQLLPYQDQPNHTVADIASVDLNILGNVEGFHSNDDFTNGSSTELAGQGMFGDYVLLFPGPVMTPSLLENINELYVRFDYLSVDNTPVIQSVGKTRPAGTLMLQTGSGPIIVE